MKLRNKKTGEIAEASILNFELVVRYGDGRVEKYPLLFDYSNFEYYKEPKKYWFIDAYGNIVQNEITKHYGDEYTDMTDAYEKQKQIGNHFETEKETEKALNKLKALKRLEDKGLLIGKCTRNQTGTYSVLLSWDNVPPARKDVDADMRLVFGG